MPANLIDYPIVLVLLEMEQDQLIFLPKKISIYLESI